MEALLTCDVLQFIVRATHATVAKQLHCRGRLESFNPDLSIIPNT